MKRIISLIFLCTVLLIASLIANEHCENKIFFSGTMGFKLFAYGEEEIDNESYINTAYVELEYTPEEKEIVEEEPVNYLSINQSYINGFNLSKYDEIIISHYSPHFVIINAGNLNDFQDSINYLNDFDEITFVHIYREFRYLPKTAFEECGVFNGMDCGGPGGGGGGGYPFEGLGTVPATNGNVNLDTKIGIIELAVPYFLDSALSNTNWKIEEPFHTRTDQHATDVAKTIVNSYPETNQYVFYSTVAIYPYQLMNGINWMKSNEVSLINISMGSDSEITYDSLKRYLDYVTKQHNILIVTATTNIPNESNTNYSSAIGLSYNSLVIGSVSSSLVYEYKSGYVDAFDISKPNLVDIYTGIKSKSWGTSFSTPRVVAKIAKILYNYPFLKQKLALLLAIIHSSSSISDINVPNIVFDETGFEDKVGVGLLSVETALETIQNQNFLEFEVRNDYPYFSKLLSFSNKRKIIVTASTLASVQKNGFEYDFLGYGDPVLKIVVNGIPCATRRNGNILYASVVIPQNSVIDIQISFSGECIGAISWRVM
ncbi:MAG TPA: S8/S53 family peptidase [Acholeplasmataceae bacterium]|nr:S8/S53 family peptidase [Acholeplasmataceae bacterium]